MPSPNPKSPMGIYCPDCKGVRLTVVSSKRPCAGVKVRYRRCSACGKRVTTREVIVTTKKMVPLHAEPK